MTDLPEVRLYIDGRWRMTAGSFEPVNPATQEPVARVADAGRPEVDAAVAAARRAFPQWSAQNPTRRAAMLHRIGEVVSRHEADLARAITLEMGKTLSEATGEVQKLASAFHFYAEEATRVHGEVIPNDVDGFTSLVVREPVGVVGAITPWNYPLELIGWKLCAALAAGCTIVVKPSEHSPVSAGALFACLDEVGLPPGVANLVSGRRHAGPLIVGHPDVDKIAFTGSTSTGWTVATGIPAAKPLSLELGGTCPMIVTAKADVDAAVAGAARRGFRNAGQICIAVNRIYVLDAVYDDFVARLGSAVAKLRTGDGMDPATNVGPLTTRAGLETVDRHVRDAEQRGARIVTGGRALTEIGPGNFYAPTVMADCTPDMLVMADETFGPVVGIMRVATLDEAVALANGTDSGLAAYAYTEDLSEAFDLGRRLDYGNVAINNVDAGVMNAPYGGRKGSGYGYEHGREGLLGYLQLKHVRIHHGV